ncbi:MAG: regulatory protein RecX [Nitrospinota bacterium]
MERSALRILALRSNTRAELRRKLRGRGFPPGGIEALLERFEKIGYLDDEATARNWVRRRLKVRPMGRRSMEGELRRIGASNPIIEGAIGDAYGEGGELDCALRAARKRLKTLGGKDKLRERLLRFLNGRGFPASVCIQAAKDAASVPGFSGEGESGGSGFASNGDEPFFSDEN